MNDQSTALAEDRTDWAQERTRLAKERTFASLVRTALSFITFGIAIAKLLPNLQPAWIAQTIGVLLILGGGVTTVFGFRSVHDVIDKLRAEGVEEPRWIVTTAMMLLLIVAILALLAVAAGDG